MRRQGPNSCRSACKTARRITAGLLLLPVPPLSRLAYKHSRSELLANTGQHAKVSCFVCTTALGKQRLAALQVIWHLLRAQREVISAAPNADHPLKPNAAAQYYTNRIGRTGRENRTKRQLKISLSKCGCTCRAGNDDNERIFLRRGTMTAQPFTRETARTRDCLRHNTAATAVIFSVSRSP